jgi:hypothetical protein
MSGPNESTVATWPRIAAHVAEHSPLSFSTDTCMRAAKRAEDPLPIRRFGSPSRPRVYCLLSELDEWIARQHRTDTKVKP